MCIRLSILQFQISTENFRTDSPRDKVKTVYYESSFHIDICKNNLPYCYTKINIPWKM